MRSAILSQTVLAKSHVVAMRVASCTFYVRVLVLPWPLELVTANMLQWRLDNSATFFHRRWTMLRNMHIRPGISNYHAHIFHNLVLYVACVLHMWAGLFIYARAYLTLESINFLLQKLKHKFQYQTFFFLVADIFTVYVLLVHVT